MTAEWHDPETSEYIATAGAAADARRAFSEAWLRFKAHRKDTTDGQATHQAYVECGVERDMAEARLELARARLTR